LLCPLGGESSFTLSLFGFFVLAVLAARSICFFAWGIFEGLGSGVLVLVGPRPFSFFAYL